MSLLPVHFLALLWRRAIRFAGMLTILCVVWLLSASEMTGQNENSILDLKIDSLSVESGDMEEALRLLRRKDYTKILIGFEKVPQWWEGKEPKNISLDVTNATVRDILDQLCEADPRYDYEVIDNVLINVFPKEARNYEGNLLNTAIQRFSVHRIHTPGGIIVAIREYAPELRDHLWQKRGEYYARKGVTPPGVPGHGFSSSGMTPQFDLELEGMTVREILNAVVLYSLKLYRERPPDPNGWRPPPTSWMYEFTLKPDDPTGLEGIPSWDTLN